MNKVRLACIVTIMPIAALAEPVTIAALGDSLTQGYGLPLEQGLVPQLSAWLSDKGVEAQVLNAGVSGDTTAGGLSRVAWTLTPDVDAMIVALGGNDLLRGVPPEASRSNLRGILEAARDAQVEVLLVGMQAPGNFGPDYKQAFDSMYPDLASEFDTVFMESFFQGLGQRDLTQARDLMQPDGIHPNAKAVGMIVEGFGPYVMELLARLED